MSHFAFTKKQRLLNSDQYQAVFSKADIKVSSTYILLLARRNALPYSRLGLIVPKKKIKLAVGRNRCKRLLRESFRQKQEDIKALDIVALVRGNFSNMNKTEQVQHIQTLYQDLINKQHKLK